MNKVQVIAEAGVNHNGDPATAQKLIEAAAKAGADTIKFQTFQAASLATETAPVATYQSRGKETLETQREMLQALELPDEAFGELKQYASELGIGFLSSPFDKSSLDFLIEDLGMETLR